MTRTSIAGSSAVRILGLATALATATLAAGCSSRFGGDDEPRTSTSIASNGPRQPSTDARTPAPAYNERQGVGASPVWMDDPAKRRGPQGQPAPYGRDTVTGLPLSDLDKQPSPQPGARPAPRGPAAKPQPRPASAGPGSSIVVVKGDTLYGLARRHGVTVAALVQANNLPTDAKIKAGQTLVIPAR